MSARASFTSRFGLLATMIGVAVGLGNVWRFPYMAGQFGGAPFVVFYLLVIVALGIPALMAEWALGRHTRRGPVGAFERAGLPAGRFAGWFFFFVVSAATAYYSIAIAWVLGFGVGQLGELVGLPFDASVVLPPESGFSLPRYALLLALTALVVLADVAVLRRGLRGGIEKASKVLLPVLLITLLALIVRSLTLPGAGAGVSWFILKFDLSQLTPTVMLAAVGQAVFTLSLGGTFMVVYGSYLDQREPLRRNAVATALADTAVGLLAGLAIFPAVFALQLEPAGGPGLLFATLPQTFARMPAGALFGTLFFLSLAGAALLSNLAAFEALTAGLTDNTRWTRPQALRRVALLVLVLALPPMCNMQVFLPWDLIFGSGMQALGALTAVVAFAWCLDRSKVLGELSSEGTETVPRWLYYWLRYAVPGAIIAVGAYWFVSEVLGFGAAP